MLVIGRKVGEAFRVGEDVLIEVVDVRNTRAGPAVRLGITAPRSVPIHRQEVYDAIRTKDGDPGPQVGGAGDT